MHTVSEPDWKKYERQIYEKLVTAGGDDAKVEFNKKVPGRFSQTDRQVDAVAIGKYGAGIEDDVTAAVDCKFYAKNVDVKDVEAFIGLVDDVGTDLGLLITTKGFSPAAKARAKNGTRGIRLHKVPPVLLADPDHLPKPYFPAHDEAYYEGDFFDLSPSGPMGSIIRFHYVEAQAHALDSEQELEWREDVLDSGGDGELRWGEDAGRRDCARRILRQRLGGEDPDEDLIEAFVGEIAQDWEEGVPWVLYSGELSYHLGI